MRATPMALTEVPAPEAAFARRPRGAPWTLAAPSPLRLAALLAAALVVLPLIAVTFLAFQPAEAGPSPAILARYAQDTALLAAGVALGATGLGAVAAWLVVMHRFPGRGLFEWALALPLAAPAYVLAYGWADLLDVAGPVHTALRTAGLDPNWLQVRTLPGAVLLLSFAFYPYVYLTARAAFLSQPVCSLDAARTLGCSPRQVFFRVALPLARPALAASRPGRHGDAGRLRRGDLSGRPDPHHGRRSCFHQLRQPRSRRPPLARASRRRGSHALAGALRPQWPDLRGPIRPPAWSHRPRSSRRRRGRGLLHRPPPRRPADPGDLARDPRRPGRSGPSTSGARRRHLLGMAGAGTAVTLALAVAIAFGARGRTAWPARVASLGYATPGAVMAIGLLAPAALIWRTAGAPAAGVIAGLVLLLYAYAARLTAAALGPIDAGLTRVTPSMDRAARTLGETEAGALRRVHAPVARGALWTAALLVFVDVLKELPATLILRPFNFDTLAVAASNYASDERLAQAAWPALLLVALAVGPVLFLSRRIARSRPGGRRP